MVGISDALGKTNVENVMRTCRADGVIIKPDAPIVPTDATWVADAKAGSIKGGEEPMVAYTYSDHSGARVAYVFCYPRNEQQQRQAIHFKATEFGIDGDAVVYNWKTGSMRRVPKGQEFAAAFEGAPVAEEWSYFVVLPIKSGSEPLLASHEKFVPEGRQLFEKTP
jgi:hypothetical protein